MCEAPATVDPEQLDELGLKIKGPFKSVEVYHRQILNDWAIARGFEKQPRFSMGVGASARQSDSDVEGASALKFKWDG